MKNYNEMLKKDLIKELEDHEHLASAVEAKDKEITNLKKQLDLNNKKYTQDYVDALKKEHTATITNLNKEKQNLEVKLSQAINQEQAKKINEELDKAVKLANLYIVRYNDSLKQRKISLDMEIFTNDLMSEKLKKE